MHELVCPVAVLWLVLGLIGLRGYFRTRQWRDLIASMLVSAGAIASLDSLDWWPLLAGLAAVAALRLELPGALGSR